jgi:flagellar hook-basal body complex protein FliE
MDLKVITPLLSALRTSPIGAGSPALQPAGKVGGAEFSKALNQALQSVSQSQNDALQMQQDFQLGNESVSLEQTMMAMQKSQIAFQAAVTVRNRMVSAYTDIMNMSV